MQQLSVLTEYDVHANTGRPNLTLTNLAADPSGDAVWGTVGDINRSEDGYGLPTHPGLLRVDLNDGSMALYPLAFTDYVSHIHIGEYVSHIHIGESGRLYVSDAKNNRLSILDPEMNVLESRSMRHTGPHLTETADGGLIMAAWLRGRLGVMRVSRAGRRKWFIEFPPVVAGLIPVYQGGRTFAVTETNRINIFEMDDRGNFLEGRDLGPADIRPALAYPIKRLGWTRSLIDAMPGPDPSMILILYDFPVAFRKVYGRSGARRLLMAYTRGQLPRAFEPPARSRFLVLAGANRLVSIHESHQQDNTCLIAVYAAPEWPAGTPLEEVAEESWPLSQ